MLELRKMHEVEVSEEAIGDGKEATARRTYVSNECSASNPLEFDRSSDVVTACIKKLADELERRLCAENLSLDAFDAIEEDDEVVVDKRTTHRGVCTFS